LFIIVVTHRKKPIFLLINMYTGGLFVIQLAEYIIFICLIVLGNKRGIESYSFLFKESIAKRVNVDTQQVEELDISAEDNPVFWGFAKKFADKEIIFNSFIFVNKIIKELFEEKIRH